MSLDKRKDWVYNNDTSGEVVTKGAFHLAQDSAGKEVGTDAAALCYPGGTLTLQTDGAYCARLCGLMAGLQR